MVRKRNPRSNVIVRVSRSTGGSRSTRGSRSKRGSRASGRSKAASRRSNRSRYRSKASSRRSNRGSRQRSQSGKRSRKRRPANKPKRYISPYIVYLKQCWATRRQKYPTEKMNRDRVIAFTRFCAAGWRRMPPEEKAQYKPASDRDKERYSSQMSKYKSEKASKPKRPLNSYMLFCADERPHVRQDMPKARVADIARELGRRWNQADSQFKAKYQSQAASGRPSKSSKTSKGSRSSRSKKGKANSKSKSASGSGSGSNSGSSFGSSFGSASASGSGSGA